MTNSTGNVHLDGNGNLDITALGSGSSWTSGRIQTTSANMGAPGGQLEVTASIQQPTGGPGYWPAFWMLGPGQWPGWSTTPGTQLQIWDCTGNANQKWNLP